MSSKSGKNDNELVFLALGGVGEIGMNLYLYGYGPPRRRQWLMVDLGITFPGDYEPGVDVILPDISFIEEERSNLVAILLTHAHEDHFGAIIDLWPRLLAPIYATPFTATLLRTKLYERSLEGQIPIHELPLKSRLDLGPFDIELVNMAHSIPEPNGVVIRTGAGMVFHSGDWKLDLDPAVGAGTDTQRLQEIGAEGVEVFICDSTNALNEGVSHSEAEVTETLCKIIREAKYRVAVTTFASNVARIYAVAQAANEAGRHLVIVGRAMERIIQVAKETGYLPSHLKFLKEGDYKSLPRDKVVALCTGSQGEPRAALARIASDNHPNVSLSTGDLVIFSSRTIPGNEKSILRIKNNLSELGIALIDNEDQLVHTSGHPRRQELEDMYRWLHPGAAIPVHGEARHLKAHVGLARAMGVGDVSEPRNGNIVRLLPGPLEIIDEAPVGRLFRDGKLIIDKQSTSLSIRRKLSFAGFVCVSILIDKKSEISHDPVVILAGVPEEDAENHPIEERIIDEVLGAFQSIPRPRRKNPDIVGEAVRRAVRANVNQIWGKKPLCSVIVSYI